MKRSWRKYLIRSLWAAAILFYVLLLGNTHQFLPLQLKNVLSGSMEPEFSAGSMILIKRTSMRDEFQPGDVITFRADENILITHRIEKLLDRETYLTKGDANNGADSEPVNKEQIIGRYSGLSIPFAGYLFMSIQSSIRPIILFIPGFFLLYLSYRLLFQKKEIIKQD